MIKVKLDGLKYLIHKCNFSCLIPDKYGKLICRATNYRKSEDNTKHVLIDLPNNFSKQCIEHLEKSGLATPVRNESNEFFSIKRKSKNIFRLESMAMINFHHVKQGRLLHVGQ